MAGEQKSNSNLRILSVVWFKVLPPKYGGQKATAVFNKHLAYKAPLICLCSLSNSTGAASYKIINTLHNNKLQFINPFCWYKILHTARVHNITHIIFEFPYYGIAAFFCKAILRKKVIIHSHNIEHSRFRQQKKWFWRLLYLLEKWTHRQADLNLFISKKDQEEAINKFQLIKEKCIVIPYCVEKPVITNKKIAKQKIVQQHSIDENLKILLFAGTLDYAPNASAVEYIYKNILPILAEKAPFPYKIIICGRNELESFQYLKELQHKHLIHAGEVENIDEYFLAADVFIDPVTDVAGLQTKILDALNHGCNVVAFNRTIEGIELNVSGNKLFIANDFSADNFVEQVIKATNIQSSTPEEFYDYYNWGKNIDFFYERLKKH